MLGGLLADDRSRAGELPDDGGEQIPRVLAPPTERRDHPVDVEVHPASELPIRVPRELLAECRGIERETPPLDHGAREPTEMRLDRYPHAVESARETLHERGS